MSRLILAKALRIPLSAFKAISKKIGIEESTDLTRAVQPARFRNFPFHGFRRETALSI
jgi:hypothetical protein